MIRLAGSSTKVFTSQNYSHTISQSVGTTYLINHNLGANPDLVVAQVLLNGAWKNMSDFTTPAGGNYYGIQIINRSSGDSWTENAIEIKVHGIAYSTGSVNTSYDSGTYTIRFKCFLFS